MLMPSIRPAPAGWWCAAIAITLFAAACGQTESSSPTAPTGVPTRSAPVPSGSRTTPTSPAPKPAPAPAPAPAPKPAPTPAPAPAPVPAPPANATGRLEVTINPNPVPYSGQPITDLTSCRDRPNTWFYEQVLRETGGSAITITERVDSFDGAVTSRSNPGVRIAANGSTTIRTRWCSATATAHTAQTNFTGTDASGRTFTVTGPTVRLLAR